MLCHFTMHNYLPHLQFDRGSADTTTNDAVYDHHIGAVVEGDVDLIAAQPESTVPLHLERNSRSLSGFSSPSALCRVTSPTAVESISMSAAVIPPLSDASLPILSRVPSPKVNPLQRVNRSLTDTSQISSEPVPSAVNSPLLVALSSKVLIAHEGSSPRFNDTGHSGISALDLSHANAGIDDALLLSDTSSIEPRNDDDASMDLDVVQDTYYGYDCDGDAFTERVDHCEDDDIDSDDTVHCGFMRESSMANLWEEDNQYIKQMDDSLLPKVDAVDDTYRVDKEVDAVEDTYLVDEEVDAVEDTYLVDEEVDAVEDTYRVDEEVDAVEDTYRVDKEVDAVEDTYLVDEEVDAVKDTYLVDEEVDAVEDTYLVDEEVDAVEDTYRVDKEVDAVEDTYLVDEKVDAVEDMYRVDEEVDAVDDTYLVDEEVDAVEDTYRVDEEVDAVEDTYLVDEKVDAVDDTYLVDEEVDAVEDTYRVDEEVDAVEDTYLVDEEVDAVEDTYRVDEEVDAVEDTYRVDEEVDAVEDTYLVDEEVDAVENTYLVDEEVDAVENTYRVDEEVDAVEDTYRGNFDVTLSSPDHSEDFDDIMPILSPLLLSPSLVLRESRSESDRSIPPLLFLTDVFHPLDRNTQPTSTACSTIDSVTSYEVNEDKPSVHLQRTLIGQSSTCMGALHRPQLWSIAEAQCSEESDGHSDPLSPPDECPRIDSIDQTVIITSHRKGPKLTQGQDPGTPLFDLESNSTSYSSDSGTAVSMSSHKMNTQLSTCARIEQQVRTEVLCHNSVVLSTPIDQYHVGITII